MPFLQVLTVSRSSSNSSYHTLQAARRIAVFEEDDDFCTLFFGGGCTCKTIHMFTQESGAFEAKSSSGTKWTSGLRFVTHLIEQGCFCLEQTGDFEQLGNGWGKVEEFWLLGNPVLGDSAPPGWKSSRSQCPWCCTRDKQSRSKIMQYTCMYVNCGCPTFQLLVL